MRLFLPVVVFVIVSVAFEGDVVWEILGACMHSLSGLSEATSNCYKIGIILIGRTAISWPCDIE
jgi:hypothetical protein